MTPKLYLVFDVESIGLHGEGFAVGGVLITDSGETLRQFCYACKPEEACGDAEDHLWVMNNVPVPLNGYNVESPRAVRDAFWAEWRYSAAKGAALVTDCGWPVEARFLTACVDDDRAGRKWDGPYPLHDLASVLLAAGKDPLARTERLPNELPEHDPLADARQSARLLVKHLQYIADPELESAEALAEDLKAGDVYFTTALPKGHQ